MRRRGGGRDSGSGGVEKARKRGLAPLLRTILLRIELVETIIEAVAQHAAEAAAAPGDCVPQERVAAATG